MDSRLGMGLQLDREMKKAPGFWLWSKEIIVLICMGLAWLHLNYLPRRDEI